MSEQKFIVMCAVSGGVTSHREAPMQSHGKVMIFPSNEAASAEAATARATRSPFGSASSAIGSNQHRPETLQRRVSVNALANSVIPKHIPN